MYLLRVIQNKEQPKPFKIKVVSMLMNEFPIKQLKDARILDAHPIIIPKSHKSTKEAQKENDKLLSLRRASAERVPNEARRIFNERRAKRTKRAKRIWVELC